MFRPLLVLAMILAGLPAVAADRPPPMSYLYYREPLAGGDRNQYLWDVLREALERTRARFGGYVMAPAPYAHERRRIHVLEHALPGITVSAFPPQGELGEKLAGVRIPVDRGLLGYRVLLIRAADQPLFDEVTSLDDLKRFTFGVMPWWADAGIMRRAGLQLVGGQSFSGLFKMLAAGRFDAFSRSAGEVIEELGALKGNPPGLAVERHLLIHYPMSYYFWFSDTPEGRRRAERVREGLEDMVGDGTLRTMFEKRYGQDIKRLGLARRRVIDLPNPSLGPEDPQLDETRLWYRP